jgi:hypothetical protein
MRRLLALAPLAALAAVAGAAAAPNATQAVRCDSHLFWVKVDPLTRSAGVFKPLTIPLDRNGHVTMVGAVLRPLARIDPSGASLTAACRRVAAPRGRRNTALMTTPYPLKVGNVLFCHGPPELEITLTLERTAKLTRLVIDRGRRRLISVVSARKGSGLSFDIANCSREEQQRGA